MPYAWSFYAVDKYINLEEHYNELEKLFRNSLNIYKNVIEEDQDLNSSTKNTYSCFELEYEVIGDGRFKIMCIENNDLEIPMVFCYAGTDERYSFIFIEWLKSEINCIIWKLQFNNIQMIDICDTAVSPNSFNNGNFNNIDYKFYNALFVFDLKTTDDNLKKMNFEVPASSCRKLFRSNEKPFKNSILPYIYEETGIKTDIIPLNSITLLNHLKITKYNTITTAFSMRDNIIHTILKQVQNSKE
ncbi:hypothetical protein TPHA_0A03580 [Tetrapisispora phaffii CBS 4417]|uniref:Uncharacterized protein n=1 Tax=Tetrapisispora phaffii (strain ATCC 24235 / CBS 4417 / NBRC 1672 / NRRL Y-8282 / UCD 70-5) TaxID=1071381 RepID=G8BNF6_TETPH|nr:hypothetical protein TPHA_0A03580 [Tetrapisispora phaffii CBS 4417]CCE61434.1 hypothetical protein TPHA_0A03580 [Tetrapisispora phaffii CBS 4417]